MNESVSPTSNSEQPNSDRPLIKRQRPHLETLQASLTVMRVGPKQVTQAVFRQLREEPLIDYETGDLRGVPWGTVDYFWKGCTGERFSWERRHLHVVWQKGDELRRCCLQDTWPLLIGSKKRHEELGKDLVKRARLAMLIDAEAREGAPEAGGQYRINWGNTGVTSRLNVDDEGAAIQRLIKTPERVEQYAMAYEAKVEKHKEQIEAYICGTHRVAEFFADEVASSAEEKKRAVEAALLWFEITDGYECTLTVSRGLIELDENGNDIPDSMQERTRSLKPELLRFFNRSGGSMWEPTYKGERPRYFDSGIRHLVHPPPDRPETPEAYKERIWREAFKGVRNEIKMCAYDLGIPGESLTHEAVVNHTVEMAAEWSRLEMGIPLMKARWEEQVEAIKALPQLFIAV